VVGGYGLQIVSVHNWIGAVFIAAPLLALALSARPLLHDVRRRLGPPDPVNWRKVHIVASLLLTLLLGATGVLLWLDPDLPRAAFNALIEVHAALTWVLIGSIPIHLFMARRKIAAAVVRRGFRPEPEPDLGFPLEEEED
jgi:hypothetical protein